MHTRVVPYILSCLVWLSAVAQAEDRYFDSNGTRIRYTVAGEGEPVLLIHGFTASIEPQWMLPGVIDALAEDYRVIALDNRGHGKSDKPHDAKKYGQEMAEDAIRLLDHLKIEKAHVVGYSMGAMITGKLLATHPDRLLSATLGGAAALREQDDPTFFHQLADSLESGRGMGPLIEVLTPAGRPKPTPDQIEGINAVLAAMNDTKALAAVARGFEGLRVTDDQLRSNRVPTLAVIGSDDPLKEGVDRIDGLMANLEVVVIEDTDHMTAFSSPRFRQAIREFLAENRSSARARKPDAVPEK